MSSHDKLDAIHSFRNQGPLKLNVSLQGLLDPLENSGQLSNTLLILLVPCPGDHTKELGKT